MELSDAAWELFFAINAALIAAAVHAWRKRDAKKRMALVATGRLCMNCDSVDVVDAPKGIRCQACGYVTSNAVLHAQVSTADIAAVTDPRASHDRI